MQNIDFEAGALLSEHSSTKRGDHRTKMYSAIVEEARGILQHEGAASFSLRKVAAAAGVPLGTLQHYFPNRTLLLSAVVTQTVGALNKVYEEISRRQFPATQRLSLLIEQSFRDISDRETALFMLQITALANHETAVANALADNYRVYLAVLSGLIGEISPRLSSKECHVRAVLIASQLEGLLVVLQSGRNTARLDDEVLKRAIHILLESISRTS